MRRFNTREHESGEDANGSLAKTLLKGEKSNLRLHSPLGRDSGYLLSKVI